MKKNATLIALAVEARRRGTTYGQLVASTTAQEQREIIEAFLQGRRRRKTPSVCSADSSLGEGACHG